MEIHQLKTFVTVAREGTITRASEKLYLSQPAVSAHIKAMEESLGFTLFERMPKGMTLTAKGQQLLGGAEKVLDARISFLQQAEALKSNLAGHLRLGIGSGSSMEPLGRLLTALAEQCPEVEVSLKYGNSTEILEAIQSGDLDGGFYNESGTADESLQTITVSVFRIFLAAPVGLVSKEDQSNWHALAEFPWIHPTSSTCCGRVMDNLLEKQGITPARMISIDSEKVTRTLITGGVGIGLLHEQSALEAESRNEVELLYEAGHSVRVLFAHQRKRDQDPMLEKIQSILETQVSA